MKCPQCNVEVGKSDSFCSSCGGRLIADGSGSWIDVKKPPELAEFSLKSNRSSSSKRLLMVVLLYLALASGSAWATFAYLDHGSSPEGEVVLGIPRLAISEAKRDSQVLTQEPSENKGKSVRRKSGKASRKLVGDRKVGVKIPPTKTAESGTRRTEPGDRSPSEGAKTAERPGASPKNATSPAPQPAARRPAARQPAARQPSEKRLSKKQRTSERTRVEEQIDHERAALNADSIKMVVRHYLPQVRACYERALKQKGSLRGRVEIRFRITTKGRIGTSSVHANTTGHVGLGKCLAMMIRRWRFPRPVGGEVEFIYPFVFSSGG